MLNCDYNRYTPLSLNLVNEEKIQVFIDNPGAGSANSLKNIHLELYFSVIHRAAGHAGFADGDQIRVVLFFLEPFE